MPCELVLRKKFTIAELKDALSKLEKSTTSVYVNAILHPLEVMEILNALPELRELLVPTSLLPLTSKNVKGALEEAGVELIALKKGRGRPVKWTESATREIAALSDSGKSAKEIALKKSIPLRTVYYYLKKEKSGPNRI